MFAISDNDRRTGSGPGKVSREVPVLFHLLDVSPRPPRTPAAPPLAVEAAVTEIPITRSLSASGCISEPSANSNPTATSEPKATSELPAQSLLSPDSPFSVTSAPLAALGDLVAPAASVPTAIIEVSAAAISETEASLAEAVHPSVPPSPDEPMPRPSSEASDSNDAPIASSPETPQSPETPVNAPTAKLIPTEAERPTPRHRARPPASEDWLSSHGKFIAAGFLVALCATIYLARARRNGNVEVAEVASPAPLIDEPPTISVPAAAAAPAAFAAGRTAVTPSPIAETSPANLIDAASANAESKVELHPPTAPPLLSSDLADGGNAGAASSGAKDSLFSFPVAAKADERIAVRSDVTAPQTVGPGPASAALASPGATQTRAELSPAYPTTSTPMPAYPVTASPPVGYPTTNSPTPSIAPPGAAPYSPPGAPPASPSAASPYPSGPVAVASGYEQMPPRAALPQPGMPQPGMPHPAMPQPTFPAGVAYRSAYAPVVPASAQNPAAASATAWTPPAPGSIQPPQYPPPTNTATGPRYERTGSGNY